MVKKVAFFITIITGILVAGCSNNDDQAFETSFDGSVDHVHGMGYAGEDDGLYFASHTGLKIYRDGEWFKTTKNFNDYMGFNAVDKGFYTSGHPGKDSDLPNPIGIHRSFDGGETLESLQFEGETDFHDMAVGYKSHDIFLRSPEQNSKLKEGFYTSTDNGETWGSITASGIEGDIFALAIHPTDSKFVAIATTTGIYLSNDGGTNFQLITEGSQGTAVFFNEDNLFYASYNTTPSLVKYNLETSNQEPMNLPELTEDGPVYIAQSQQDNQEFAIYTTKGHAYLSGNAAASWVQILESGQIK
ncbi:F510_1955 family glycosylhydrolase [Virgibacillus byunsanensis]|uniref:F510_1955 family glycosylhydrolase n=1 Tax=Virgibacillus byunsanensis TaxID=570945 RepID=A0ABW3LP99_9BACI